MIRCLIVDDEPPARELLASYVSRLDDLELVDKCGNALEAFTCLQKHSIDLMFLDIQMPKMTGLELSRKLRVIRPYLPIIICTGFSEINKDKTVEQIGASHILYKPATIRDLALAARKVLDNG